MCFSNLLKASLLLGVIAAALLGDLRAMVFTAPLALTVLSAAGVLYLFATPPRR